MRLWGERRAAHDDQSEAAAEDGADLVEDDLVDDGRVPSQFHPVALRGDTYMTFTWGEGSCIDTTG